MSEGFAESPAGVRLFYETFGSPEDPLILLIMGLGLDLLWWREDFCRSLAARGFHVVRYDNRDVGRSTHFTGPVPSGMQFIRRRATATYTLGDMADDGAAVIDALGGSGHVVGVSLGSMIAQELAIRHPAKTLSLTSIMGRPGDGRTGKVSKRMMLEFLRTSSGDPTEALVKQFRRIGSRGRTEEDDDDVRAIMPASTRREAGDGSGSGRQLAAILSERDRTPDLRQLSMPALVIHGTRDRIILPSGGRATAKAIPGARLLEVDDMGHDLARWTWPTVIDAIVTSASSRSPHPSGT